MSITEERGAWRSGIGRRRLPLLLPGRRAQAGNEGGEAVLADFIGTEDAALRAGGGLPHARPADRPAADRDRQIIHMRFVEELTQAQIGERLGVSQMHVSRLITRTLAKLREGMLTTK
ncbi:hypothetical protein SFUMM280S_11523 [Streptomyces fumanus]